MAPPTRTSLRTRASLLLKLKSPTNDQAWQQFSDVYYKLLYSVALKAGLNHEEAEEAVQETMICVSKKMPEFEYDPAKGRFKGWLLKLARWRIDDQFRKRQRLSPQRNEGATDTRRTSTVARLPDPHGCELDAIMDKEWNETILDAALKQVKRLVSNSQFQIFDLHVLKELPVEKVAQMLGVSRQSVYLAKFRVSKRLAEELRKLEQR